MFKVDSFVFFGTANTLYQQLKAHISEQKASKPKAERTKYLIFDLTEVTGIDSSARDIFYKVHRLLKNEGIKLVWAITNRKVKKSFGKQGLYVGATHFNSLELALRHVEDELLLRARRLSGKWLVNDTVRNIFQRQGEMKLSLVLILWVSECLFTKQPTPLSQSWSMSLTSVYEPKRRIFLRLVFVRGQRSLHCQVESSLEAKTMTICIYFILVRFKFKHETVATLITSLEVSST